MQAYISIFKRDPVRALKRSWGGEVRNVSVLVAVGVNKEDKESWRNFLRYLKKRKLNRVKLFITDKSLGLVETIGEFYSKARWQRCVVHFYRNVFSVAPKGKVKEVIAMLKAIHAQEDRKEAVKKAATVVKKLQSMKLPKAADTVKDGIEETLSYYVFSSEHWRKIRTNNPLESIMREIRRRTRVVGSFPDGNSALMLVAARLRHIATTKWGTRMYMKMDRIDELSREAIAA